MSVKNKQKNTDIVAVAKKLNEKLENSGIEFNQLQEVGEGQYQFLVNFDKNKASNLFFEEEESIRALVREKRVHPNSLLARMNAAQEISYFNQSLDLAKQRDALKAEGGAKSEGASLDLRYRDVLSNPYLDLRSGAAEETDAVKLYDRSQREYYRTGIYGTTIDLLSNFAAAGYYNEITSLEIKEFFDSWVFDVNFINLVKRIFHSLFKYSVCYIMKGYSVYEPNKDGISSIPGKEPSGKTKVSQKAAIANLLNDFLKKTVGSELDFEKFSGVYDKELGKSGKYPVFFSILDPKFVTVTNSGFSNDITVTLTSKGLQPLKKLSEAIKKDPTKVSKSTKDSLKLLPPGLLQAAEEGKSYTFKDEDISVIYLRKDDYESYAKPRGARAFDSFDYKDELKKADYATVDGIYNFILKVTVGDKDNPVTDVSVLESIAEAFNTPQKAFTIVWNHTLKIEKITATEVGNILGMDKYVPVNEDITAALGVTRALIDGQNLQADAAKLAAKAIQSEIHSARQQVEIWIYQTYKLIARSAGFSTFPVVRWKESVINTDSDAVTRNSFLTMLDRKAISFQTWMREQGLDYDTEIERMRQELPLIQEGILRIGSPFQQTKEGNTAPSGDSGRPVGQPKTEKQPIDELEVVKRQTKTPKATQQLITTDSLIEGSQELISQLLGLDEDTKSKIVLELTRDFCKLIGTDQIPSEEASKKKRSRRKKQD